MLFEPIPQSPRALSGPSFFLIPVLSDFARLSQGPIPPTCPTRLGQSLIQANPVHLKKPMSFSVAVSCVLQVPENGFDSVNSALANMFAYPG